MATISSSSLISSLLLLFLLSGTATALDSCVSRTVSRLAQSGLETMETIPEPNKKPELVGLAEFAVNQANACRHFAITYVTIDSCRFVNLPILTSATQSTYYRFIIKGLSFDGVSATYRAEVAVVAKERALAYWDYNN